ncbi:hypothetical protein AMS68_007164 [Peltaster fructicola]|uniref:3-beta hydroxysteroid dehydrogenase/isomerase domain-containing protein n=1 Tax=Peltaster fructicola TaxID=286661 RepID=A0A6H0Y3Q2_9PEZI|nr:hypothetical protein AMS68_007164 [Peltaster fructicola]
MHSDTTAHRILITGASGFLGRQLVCAIAKKHPSWQISGLDRVSPPSDVEDELEHFFLADVANIHQLEAAYLNGPPHLVIHTAAIVPARGARYSTKASDWEHIKAVNYGGTINVFSTAMRAGCRRFIYTSSVTAVMDDLEHDYHNAAENTVWPAQSLLHYGRSKLLTETYIRSLNPAEVKTCILRPCTIFGPEDTAVMSVLHDLIAKGETSFVVGDGNNLSDWMYIDNAVHAHVLTAENMLSSATAAGHTIYITNHEPVYFWDFLAFVWAQFGHQAPFRVFIPAYLAFLVAYMLELVTMLTQKPATLTSGSVKDGVRTFFVNNDKAIDILGYRPVISLAEGVRRACEGYKEHLKARR